jgi:hypothetical protein
MSYPWKTRGEGEATAEYLGRVLEDYAGLPDLAMRARAFHFDDYFAPPEVATGTELHVLVDELTRVARHASGKQRARAHTVIDAVKNGEFDGTKEESERWMASPDGQAAVRLLVPEED